jgi:hypothetical protein
VYGAGEGEFRTSPLSTGATLWAESGDIGRTEMIASQKQFDSDSHHSRPAFPGDKYTLDESRISFCTCPTRNPIQFDTEMAPSPPNLF